MSQVTNEQKWIISLYSGILFALIASPWTFRLVNSLTANYFHVIDENGCPTIYGLILHTAVFIIIVRIIMQFKLPGAGEKNIKMHYHNR